jgi:hypothetical protein
MSEVSLSQNAAPVKPIATPAEKAERMEAFKHFTADDYDHMRRIVCRYVPAFLADREDVLADVLALAVTKYDGRTKLTTFVAKNAIWRAMMIRRQYAQRAHHPVIPFHDLLGDEHQDSQKQDELIDRMIGGTLDTEPTEPIDPRFIERIEELLESQEWNHYPKIKRIAKEIVTVLAENASQGKGLGIDEYEYAAMKKPNHPNDRLKPNLKGAKTAVKKGFARQLHVQDIDVWYAFRKHIQPAAELALKEGWLDYHSNPTPKGE